MHFQANSSPATNQLRNAIHFFSNHHQRITFDHHKVKKVHVDLNMKGKRPWLSHISNLNQTAQMLFLSNNGFDTPS